MSALQTTTAVVVLAVIVAIFVFASVFVLRQRMADHQRRYPPTRETRAQQRVRKTREYEQTGDPEVTLVLPPVRE